jgi:hypothetical protein
LFSANAGLTFLEGNCVIDSGQTSGIRNLKGSGIKAITKVATGVYKVELEDTFARYLGGFSGFVSSVTGNTSMGSLTPGNIYIIRTLGNSTQAQWEAAGVPAGVAAAPGLTFVATAVGAGTGTCFTQAPSKVQSIEVIGNANLSVTQLADPHFFIATMGPTSSSDTTPIPVAPTDGSVLGISMMLRNSSVKGKGE